MHFNQGYIDFFNQLNVIKTIDRKVDGNTKIDTLFAPLLELQQGFEQYPFCYFIDHTGLFVDPY